MRRLKRRIKRLILFVGIIVVMLIYSKVMNGKLLYFTTGFDKRVLMEVKNQDIYDYEALILYGDVKNQYESLFGSDVWSREIEGESFVDYAKENARTKLIRVACMNLMAQDRGVVLSREENNNVTKAAKEYMEKLTEKDSKRLSVTQEDIEYMMRQFAMANRLYMDMTNNIQIEVSADEARVIKIQYISCGTREDAQKALNSINGGENFYQVARRVNGDGEYECELKRGQTEKGFEDVVFGLESGETSEILESMDRFFIVRCVSDNEKNKTDNNKNDIITKKKLDEFNKVFEKYESSIFVHINDKMFNELSFDNLEGEASFEELFNKYFR